MTNSSKSVYFEIGKGDTSAFDRAIRAIKDSVFRTDAHSEEYAAYVRDRAQISGSSELFLNRGITHAAIIIEAIFEAALDLVEIFTANLDASIYSTPGVIASATTFLSRNATAHIDIISEAVVDPELYPLFRSARNAGLVDRIRLHQLPQEVAVECGFHFVVADGRHFRFESSRENREAIVQFNNQKFGATLRATFTKLVAQSLTRSVQ
jgi:hypothetical protein